MACKTVTGKTAYVLREEQFEGYNWNIGDHLIHAGVTHLLLAVGVAEFAYINRKKFSVPGPEARADLIAYAGMPQFAAADRASMDDQAWAMLRHRFPPPTPALDIGCGTGYALHVNRLRVAANMAAERYNQWFFASQRDVKYLTRDPLSRYFLRAMGMRAELGVCPSMLVEAVEATSSPTLAVAIALANPEVKFDRSQEDRLHFDFKALFCGLLSIYPDALVICQEPADLTWAKSIGVKNLVLPETLDEFVRVCGSARTLISTRVHATVSAFMQDVDVLHLAIDGRSDLLTPLMAGGLWKIDLFTHSLDEILRFSMETSSGYGRVPGWRQTIEGIRARMVEQVGSYLSSDDEDNLDCYGLTLNPEQCSLMRSRDIAILTANAFRTHCASSDDEVIVVPLDGREGIQIFGPYIGLVAGTYDVDFDFDWWGRVRSLNASVHIDVAWSGNSIASRTIPLSDLLTSERLPRLRFRNPGRHPGLEFRVAISGANTGLQMRFYGICLTAT